jgi:cytochrome c-type biogenesis protein
MKDKSRAIYFVIAILALAIFGLIGYYFGFLGFIYNVMIPGTFSEYNIVFLSILFGIAAFFSPCAFTVLPSYVSYYVGKKSDTKLSSLYFGLIGALGIITVNMVIGLLIGLLGSATPFAKDPRQDIPIILGIRTIAGLIIVFLGISTLIGKSINLHFIKDFFTRQNFSKGIYSYGIIYNAAAIGCTGPILLGLMLYAYASGSFMAAILAFAIFSLTMGILMIITTLLTGMFKQAVVKKVVKITPIIKTLSSLVMIIAGLSIVLLTLEGNNIFVQIFFPYLK